MLGVFLGSCAVTFAVIIALIMLVIYTITYWRKP
jgi:hypothetical protein